jgi:glutamine amidotransferase
MCRIFGFHSIIQSQIHSSLAEGDQSFMHLSQDHPDGWGVAYYVDSAPHVVKSESAAIRDRLFQRVSGIVSSNTVVAHLLKATLGNIDITNTHPFQYGRWIFAHNGNIKGFAHFRNALLQKIPDDLRRFIIGDTDSEVIFYLLLKYLRAHQCERKKNACITDVSNAVSEALREIISIVGPFALKDGPPTETYMSFILTNGDIFLAHQGGKPIFYSTHKTRCSEKNSCPYFTSSCEAESKDGKINHLLFSSEPISGENIWTRMSPGSLIGVDSRMIIKAITTQSILAS